MTRPRVQSDAKVAMDAIERARQAEAMVERLAVALRDVVDTSPGDWEHFDGHCTRETECCAGHVARVLAELSPEDRT